MRRVAVIGVGVTRFGKHDRTSAELFAQAASEAIADAEVSPGDVQALGAAQIAEIVTQIRGEAGSRPVEGARTGLAHTLGGNTATVLVSLLGRN